MKKALLITYYYSPSETPRALRWGALVNALSNDFSFDIVSGPNAAPQRSSAASGKSGRGIKSFIRGCLRPVWRALYWPDFACFWYFKARGKAIALNQKNNYDIIISVSLPFTSHLVGAAVKKKNKDAFWMMDTGDSFSVGNAASVNNECLYSWLSRFTERRIVQAADAIVVTTEEQRALYDVVFEQVDKTHVIPPLYTPKQPENLLKKDYGSDVTIAFFGMLYKGIRSPSAFLEVFKQLLFIEQQPFSDLKVRFYGGVVDCEQECTNYELALKGRVSFCGKVSHDDVYAYAQAADVLLNIGNLSKTQLPSKVVECLAFGKPIINVAASEEDLSLRFFSPCPWVCNLITADPLDVNVGKLKSFLEKLPVVDHDKLALLLKPYCSEQVSNDYKRILLSQLGA